MVDALEILYRANPFSPTYIKRIEVGAKYVGVMHANGNIGTCATLMHGINGSPLEILSKPNFSSYTDRILVNAWLNSCLNYHETVDGNSDIFDAIPFEQFERVVMIGYFGSLVQKFDSKGIKLTIFDLNENDLPVVPIEHQALHLEQAECVILTATTLANGTCNQILSAVSNSCSVFMLGPSAPLVGELFDLYPIKGIFGARFAPFDHEVLDTIRQGGGTRSFMHRMEKVYITNDYLNQ